MKINVFQYIDEAIACLDAQRPSFNKAAISITGALRRMLAGLGDDVLDVTYRIKEDDSLREKILRKDLYKKYAARELLSEMHDIIGVRIECRFLSDEKLLYEYLKTLFTETRGDGYFFVPGKERLKLKLDAPQPEVQLNGFEIYRIDGRITAAAGDFYCNFELQIKSLVNAFWSEIEHKIVYKNKRFMMIDGFVTEQMQALNQNLYLIDRQLNALYNRCLDQSTSLRQKQIEQLLTMFINELFSRLVKDSLGFEVGIKSISESVVKYIFSGSSFLVTDDNQPDMAFGRTLQKTLNWMRQVDFTEVRVGENIAFEAALAFSTPLERAVADRFLSGINEDFFCNLFFHILFSLEVGDNASDFTDYVRYYCNRIAPGRLSDAAAEAEARAFFDAEEPGYLVSEEAIKRLRDRIEQRPEG